MERIGQERERVGLIGFVGPNVKENNWRMAGWNEQ
jgi:hypothetical protein